MPSMPWIHLITADSRVELELLSCLNGLRRPGLEIAGKLIDSGAVDLVVVDSVVTSTSCGNRWNVGDKPRWFAKLDEQAMRKLSELRSIRPRPLPSLSTNLREKVGMCLGTLKPHRNWSCPQFYALRFVWCPWSLKSRDWGQKIPTLVGKPRSSLKNRGSSYVQRSHGRNHVRGRISRTGEWNEGIATDLDMSKRCVVLPIMAKKIGEIWKC